MSVTIKQTEEVPAAYPDAPSGLSANAAALDEAMVWERIEAHTAYRYSPREVVWIVEGEGFWSPPLAPATINTTELWDGETWGAVTLSTSPLDGLCLATDGPYRISASVGGGNVPAAVSEAFRRLAEYSADANKSNMLTGRPGASVHTGDIKGISETIERNPAWVARALQWSGAADLLRSYRRAS
ncbi:hypothetical protein AAFO92_13815 [Roseovarius sp. CAU 1744]|uniref:hypothetical protein n=1 Tax=Roseovarius sp. CAU 1744 TaxID=3140368 RepID=UPI00325ABE6A